MELEPLFVMASTLWPGMVLIVEDVIAYGLMLLVVNVKMCTSVIESNVRAPEIV
jgi:hypothetical protein